MKRRQGLKGKPGEFGTTGGNSGGSLIAQARNRAQRRVRSRGVYSHRGCCSHPRPQLEAPHAVSEAHGTPALRNNQRWSVHQVRSKRCSGGVCRSSYRLTWEALGRADRVAPSVLTLSVDDRVSRVRGAWRCGRSQFRVPALLDARKLEAYVLTFAWTAGDRRSGYNPHAWRAAGPCDDLERQHMYQVRENNGHQTEQDTRSSITTPINRGEQESSHATNQVSYFQCHCGE